MTAGAPWQKTDWRGESAWRSACGPFLAVVTETRQRLIYFGSIDGTQNLLNAPYPQTAPSTQNPWPNQGGHRFWLGPQNAWTWPPLTEWEYAPAEDVRLENDILILRQARLNPDFPAITREYAWVGARLRCTARWSEGTGKFFGMHVVPVDIPLTVRAQLVPSAEVRLGLVEVRMDGAAIDGFLPHPAVTLDGAHATLRSGEKVIKLGFPIQPLTIRRAGGWQLSVLPGPHDGMVVNSPDHGCLSQIWVGGPEHDLAELEQLTPYLRNDSSGRCGSTIFLTAMPPAGR